MWGGEHHRQLLLRGQHNAVGGQDSDRRAGVRDRLHGVLHLVEPPLWREDGCPAVIPARHEELRNEGQKARRQGETWREAPREWAERTPRWRLALRAGCAPLSARATPMSWAPRLPDSGGGDMHITTHMHLPCDLVENPLEKGR